MTVPSDYPWYSVVNPDDGLQQGDVLERVVVQVPDPKRGEQGEVVDEAWNLKVMTQSCDIEDDIAHIICCPIWTQEQLAEQDGTFRNRDTIGNLTKGRMIGFYPISRSQHAGMVRPFRVVQFQRIIELERTTLEGQLQSIGPRLRLLPPYREHLSQAFARFFMRVGLPVPIEL